MGTQGFITLVFLLVCMFEIFLSKKKKKDLDNAISKEDIHMAS